MPPDKLVAKARPFNFKGYIRIRLKTILTKSEAAVILSGVLLSLSEKNPETSTLLAA